jgi:iron complex outermembrane receptor protein
MWTAFCSNLLGNSGFTPRWGLVTPEEIERVDVLYGPFSAAYPGNSVGAVVDYVTRMPTELEIRAKVSTFGGDVEVWGIDDRYTGRQTSASVGARTGDWSGGVNYNRLDSNGHPLGFANKLVSTGSVDTAGTPVTGALDKRNPRNEDWLILGSTTQTNTVQDHAKAKVAYDISEMLRVSYTFGWWENEAARSSESYLQDAAGNAVYSGSINVDGRRYTMTPTDLAPSRGDLQHLVHGVSIKSSLATARLGAGGGVYDYARDLVRSPTVALPAATGGRDARRPE